MALVVGYGNPLRADDGVGWQVTQRLAADRDDDTEIISTQQLTPELAEPISRARFVVFVDARVDGQPGTINCEMVVPAVDGSPPFSHDIEPAVLLQLARLVYDASPPAVIVSIVGADFSYGGGLSQEVQTVIPGAVRLVRALLADGVGASSQLNAVRSTGSAEGRASCTS